MQRSGTVVGSGRARRPGRRVAQGVGTALVAAVALGLTSPSQVAALTPGTAPGSRQVASAPGSYILRAAPGRLTELSALLAGRGIVVRQRISLIDAVVADLPAGAAAQLRTSPVLASVTPNEAVSMLGSTGKSTKTSSTQTAAEPYAPAADAGSLFTVETLTGVRSWWSKYTGAGVDVALIDSGVAPVAGLDATGKVVNGPDLSPESQSPLDREPGHLRPRHAHGRDHRRPRRRRHPGHRRRRQHRLHGRRPRRPDRQRQGGRRARQQRRLAGDRRHRLGGRARQGPGHEHPGDEPVVRHQRAPRSTPPTRWPTRSRWPGARASSWSPRPATAAGRQRRPADQPGGRPAS